MAHITLPEGAQGIVGPMMAYPETSAPLNALAQALLHGPSSLSKAERELIATHVSSGNGCNFCTQSHAAVAREHFGDGRKIVDDVLADLTSAPVSEKMMALLGIAGKVRKDGKLVTADDVARARAAGADDKAIHDTVLIAAAFCMYNRYVEGLGTFSSTNPADYLPMGVRLAAHGYRDSV